MAMLKEFFDIYEEVIDDDSILYYTKRKFHCTPEEARMALRRDPGLRIIIEEAMRRERTI